MNSKIQKNSAATAKRLAQDKKQKTELRRHKEILTELRLGRETQLQTIQALAKFLKGHTTKTEVINHLEKIGTPDIAKVVTALGKLEKTVKGKDIDLSGLIEVLGKMEAHLDAMPKEHPEAPEAVVIDFGSTNELLAEFGQKIESLASVKPAPINVKPADVKVHTQVVDLGELKQPLTDIFGLLQGFQFPEIVPTDMAKTEKLLEESNKHLKKLVDKPVGGGGGGGMVPFKDPTTGFSIQVPTETDLSLPVTVKNFPTADPFAEYKDARQDLAGDPMYFGKEDPDGNWLIKRFAIAGQTSMYYIGTGGISSAWAGRAGYTYLEYNQL